MSDLAELLSRLRVAEIVLDNLLQDQSQDGSRLIIDSAEASRISKAISEAVESIVAIKPASWYPIEAAPKDRLILVSHPNYGTSHIAGFSERGQYWKDGIVPLVPQPTVWMEKPIFTGESK